jgi:predicted Zn-dependent protease
MSLKTPNTEIDITEVKTELEKLKKTVVQIHEALVNVKAARIDEYQEARNQYVSPGYEGMLKDVKKILSKKKLTMLDLKGAMLQINYIIGEVIKDIESDIRHLEDE